MHQHDSVFAMALCHCFVAVSGTALLFCYNAIFKCYWAKLPNIPYFGAVGMSS